MFPAPGSHDADGPDLARRTSCETEAHDGITYHYKNMEGSADSWSRHRHEISRTRYLMLCHQKWAYSPSEVAQASTASGLCSSWLSSTPDAVELCSAQACFCSAATSFSIRLPVP